MYPAHVLGVIVLVLHCLNKLLLFCKSLSVRIVPVSFAKGWAYFILTCATAQRYANLVNIVRAEVNGTV
jgi:hypothetical protein